MAVRFSAAGEGYIGQTGLPADDTYTVTFWGYVSADLNNYSTFISLDSDSSYTEIATSTDGVSLRVYNWDSGIDPAFQLTVGTWYAMAYVQDGTNGTLYWGTDPASLSTHSSAITPHSITHFRIGHFKPNTSTEWLNGRMAAVKVWDAALTAPEIEAELQSYDPIVTANLLRVHKLQVPEPTDYSGNGNTLTGGLGASTEDDPPITDTAGVSPGRFLLAYEGAGSTSGFVYTNRPTQPMRYHYDQAPLEEWAHPGALVIAGLGRSDIGPPGISPAYEGTDPGYIAAAAAGATVIAYIDPIIDNDWGLYHELLLHEFDSLGRTVGPEAALWPGDFTANEWGNLADFRVGSVIQQKFKAVLELMLDENPWLAGFWLDDVGTRSWYPGFSWETDFTATDRAAYRAGAVAFVQTARQVCDTKRMPNGRRRIIIVNGTWTAGTLLEDGGGYPNMAVHGCSLAEGGEIEHHTLDSWWTAYANGSQWATEASTNGVPFMVASCETDAIQDDFVAANILSHSESAESNGTVWGSFHETGLPSNHQPLYPGSDLYPSTNTWPQG